MSDAKLGFRLPTYKASEVVLDESGLETLPSLPGRAIYKTDRLTELQVPFISDEMMWEYLKQYEVKKDEHPDTYQNKPSDDDSDLD
jgi:S-DNA-T family DNA segregation ATPase FtsK/SpoIIIE